MPLPGSSAEPTAVTPTKTSPKPGPAPKRLPSRLEDVEIAQVPDGHSAENATEPAASLDIAMLNAAWPDFMRWAESAYPSLSPILTRQSYRVSGPRLVLLTATPLEGELLMQAREAITGTISRLCGLTGIGLETAVDVSLTPEPTERPLTLDEHRRRLQQADANFRLLEQTFQTFLDP